MYQKIVNSVYLFLYPFLCFLALCRNRFDYMPYIGGTIRNCMTHLGGNKQNLVVTNARTSAFLTATASQNYCKISVCAFLKQQHSFWMRGVCCYFWFSAFHQEKVFFWHEKVGKIAISGCSEFQYSKFTCILLLWNE